MFHKKSMKHFYCAVSNIAFWVLSHEYLLQFTDQILILMMQVYTFI